jgi:hypothetical protein
LPVVLYGFSWGNWRARDHLKDPEDNIKMDLQEVGCGGMGWIKLAQDRNRWQARVNAEMNLWVLYNMGNFLTS